MRPISKALRPPFRSPLQLFQKGAQGAWYDPSSLWGAADHLPRRNLLTSSDDFSSSTYVKDGVTYSSGRITDTATTAVHGIYRNSTATGVTNPYWICAKVKKGTVRYVCLFAYVNANSPGTCFDLDTNSVAGECSPNATNYVVSGSSFVEDLGNGWVFLGTRLYSEVGYTQYHAIYHRSAPYTSGAIYAAYAGTTGNYTDVEGYGVYIGNTRPTSHQKITDWTTEQYAWAASKNVPWLRRNMLTYTEDFSQSQWQKSSVSVTSSGITPPTGKSLAWKVTHAGTLGELYGPGASGSIPIVAGQYYSLKIAVKYFDTAWVRIGMVLPGASSALCWCNTQTGSLGAAATVSGTATDPTQAIASLGAGWYEVTLTVKAGTSGTSGYAQINSASGDASGSRVIGSYLTTAIQVSVGSATYQPIGASWEAQFAANAAAAGVVPTLYQDSAGTTPVTGPDSVVGFLGDLAQGYALGSELMTNGTFDSNITGWTATGSVTASWSSGSARLTATGPAQFSRSYDFIGGKTYLISGIATLVSGTLNCTFTVRTTNAYDTSSYIAGSSFVSGETVKYLYTPASNITAYISARPVSGTQTVDIDNISVRELPGYHAIQSGATGLKPTLRLSPNGYWYIQRDLSDDALVTTFPNLGSNCALYLNDGATVTETTGLTLNGALTQNTPAADYGRVYLNAPSPKAAQLIKWLKAKAGL